MSQIKQNSIYRRLFALAIPVSIGQAGNIIANIVDTIMLGKYDADHMIASASGFQVFIMPFIFLIGICIGTTTIVAKSVGEGKKPSILGSAFLTYFIAGIFVASLLWGLSNNMHWFHPDQNIQALTSPYLKWLGLSVLPIVIFLTLKQFFEGYELSILTTIISLVANGLNIVLNYAFIFGNWGMEPMGVEGAGIATFISRVVAVPLFLLLISLVKSHKEKISLKGLKPEWSKCKELLLLGIPMGFQMFIEVVAFAMAGIMTGWIGNDEQAAHQIALQLAAFTFLIASGFSSAATVLAGQFLGERNKKKLKELIKKVLLLILVYEVVSAIALLSLSGYFPYLFLKKEELEIIVFASLLIKLAAIFQIPDGLQNMLHGLLRGLQDVKWPTYLSIASHWGITLLGGYLLAFHTSLGIIGIWLGFIIGLTVLSILLLIRLKRTYKLIEI